MKFGRGAQQVRFAYLTKRMKEVRPTMGLKTTVLWGPSGTGKSHRARAILEEEGIKDFDTVHVHKASGGNGVWWDEYEGADAVIIDDFSYKNLPLDEFCNIFDKYPMKLQVKGSMIPRVFWRCIITTNEDPAEWYKPTIDAVQPYQITRRIPECIYMGDRYIEPADIELVDMLENLQE